MQLMKKASLTIAVPREHVAATLVRTDLEATQFYDSRTERVESNGLPDGAVGQVVRMTARVWGQEVEIVQTTLVSELPGRLVDRMDMPGDTIFTDTRLTALDATSTRIDQVLRYDIAPWKVLKILMTTLTAGGQIHKAMSRFAEFAELTYRPTSDGAGSASA